MVFDSLEGKYNKLMALRHFGAKHVCGGYLIGVALGQSKLLVACCFQQRQKKTTICLDNPTKHKLTYQKHLDKHTGSKPLPIILEIKT